MKLGIFLDPGCQGHDPVEADESEKCSQSELHCQYAGKLGISKEELEAAQPAPTTLAYSHYMLAVAHSGSIAHLLAALLPCLWSYWSIGKELSRIPGSTEHPFYGIWVKMYSSEDFGQLARWAIDLMNQEAVEK